MRFIVKLSNYLPLPVAMAKHGVEFGSTLGSPEALARFWRTTFTSWSGLNTYCANKPFDDDLKDKIRQADEVARTEAVRLVPRCA
jgi:hypothetical protein